MCKLLLSITLTCMNNKKQTNNTSRIWFRCSNNYQINSYSSIIFEAVLTDPNFSLFLYCINRSVCEFITTPKNPYDVIMHSGMPLQHLENSVKSFHFSKNNCFYYFLFFADCLCYFEVEVSVEVYLLHSCFYNIVSN